MDLEIFVLFLLEAECANALTHKSVFQEATTHTHTHKQNKHCFSECHLVTPAGLFRKHSFGSSPKSKRCERQY